MAIMTILLLKKKGEKNQMFYMKGLKVKEEKKK